MSAVPPMLAPLAAAPRGNWLSEFGDPTIAGWLTAVLALVAAFVCARVGLALRARAGRGEGGPRTRREALFWLATAGAMLLYAINVQLDLQILLTDLGRRIAKEQGWYDDRRAVQREFVIVFVGLVAVALGALIVFFRSVIARIWLVLVGLGLLAFYVVVRAASIHHLDVIAVHRIGNVRVEQFLQIVAIGIVLIAGRLRRRRLAE